jgi:tetratricopeptide (TPR) repeat protein
LALFEEAGVRLEAVSPEVAFALGLEGLEMGRADVAQRWYEAGLDQTKEGDDSDAAEQAMMNLYRALLADERLEAKPILALFREAGIEVVPDEAAVAFDLAVAWLILDDQGEAARYSDMGLVLAVGAGDIELVRAGAHDLRDYFLGHPEVDQAAAYWPLHDNTLARRRAVAGLDRPDLYWRYRAEFGFHLLADRSLMRQNPGNAQLYDEIFQVVMEDIERAYALDPEEHQTWRDFFVDANIGWLYLRLGDDYGREGMYEEALAAYGEATRRMQPDSQNAALDLTDAYFGAGLTALRLERYTEAEAWYEGGIDLVGHYDAEFRLSRKVKSAVEALDELLTENPGLAQIGQPIREALEALR